eukprot:12325738-Alexandrium_andersonii.AAC.1
MLIKRSFPRSSIRGLVRVRLRRAFLFSATEAVPPWAGRALALRMQALTSALLLRWGDRSRP